MHWKYLLALFNLFLLDAVAFSVSRRPVSAAFASLPTRPAHYFALFASGGKGFGAEPVKKKTEEVEDRPISAQSSGEAMNAGQRALAEMRRQRAEQKDRELQRVRELIQADKQVQETPAAIPEKVAQRMGARMLPFVGLPLFLGMGSFVAFWYLATYKNMEFQPAMVATTTIALLAVGLLGITYSVMSASWDPDRDGDLLGVDEFKNNVKNVQEGLKRSRENAILRDKMSGLSESELEVAVSELERKEKAEETRTQTLENKLKEELQ